MKKPYTDTEIKQILKTLEVIVDTREKENSHILKYLESKKVPTESRTLDTGDYSATVTVDGVKLSIEDEVCIEKKNSIDEIAGNFTADRERFEREFLRAKAKGVKMYLFIENASYEKIKAHGYTSKTSPEALLASLLSWQTRFNITVVFCNREMLPEILLNTLYYAARESLKGGRMHCT